MRDDPANSESLVDQIKDKFNELVGLPSRKITDLQEVPRKDLQAPRDTLTSDDTESQQHGTGIAVN